VNWLEAVGLKVNGDKSFLAGNFKESCGVDAFRGVDITPLYLKHRPDQSVASPTAIAGFIAFSNNTWKRGLYETSTWVRNLVEDLLGKSLPMVSEFSGAFGWHSRLDTMHSHKWCVRTHRFLTRTLVLVPIKRDDRLDGYAALLKCLSQPQEEDALNELPLHKREKEVFTSLFPKPMARDPDHLSSTAMRYKVRMVQRWVPTLTRVG